jgi:hypothetical protein
MRGSVTNPVPRMMQSTGRSTPSSVTMPDSVTSRMRSVTSSTFGRRNIGNHLLDTSTRLQPMV